MRTLILLSSSLLAFGTSAGAAAANDGASKPAASCDAKYFKYLVGQSVYETRSISGVDYRVVSGTAADISQPKRVTFIVDKQNVITGVTCG